MVRERRYGPLPTQQARYLLRCRVRCASEPLPPQLVQPLRILVSQQGREYLIQARGSGRRGQRHEPYMWQNCIGMARVRKAGYLRQHLVHYAGPHFGWYGPFNTFPEQAEKVDRTGKAHVEPCTQRPRVGRFATTRTPPVHTRDPRLGSSGCTCMGSSTPTCVNLAPCQHFTQIFNTTTKLIQGGLDRSRAYVPACTLLMRHVGRLRIGVDPVLATEVEILASINRLSERRWLQP